MYYKDQYGNVVEYSQEHTGVQSNGIHPGGVGYHPMTREDFSMSDVSTWFEKYKMWFLYALIAIVLLAISIWLYRHYQKKSVASVFY